MLATNQILQDRYRIIRKLGAGGMGAVYEAIDERFGQPIALKEIIIDSTDENQRDSVSRAFEREAKALAKAKHEAVPFVRDYFFELDRQFLVMELVEGKDLGEMLGQRKAPFPLDETLNWMDQLLDALDYLHNLKPPIIHRDIKPQNLKLNARDKIKLLDFGIARSGDKSNTITNQTFVGATLNYSPIEQILRVIDSTFREFIILKHKEKAEHVLSLDTDARCDIYSLGGTFYHLLTNRVPVEATKRTLDIWEGKPDPLINPSALNPHIPPAIAACLMKALAIDYINRYTSALEMQKALKNAIKQGQSQNTAEINKNTSSQLETLPLITREDLQIDKPTEQNLSNPSVPNQFFDAPLIQTQSPPIIESDLRRTALTMSSGNLVNSDLTSASYLEGILPEEKKTSPDIASFIEKPIHQVSSKTSKLFWVIPIVVIGFMALAAIGGLAWIGLSLGGTFSNKSTSNITVLTPSPQVTPTVSPIATATITPTATPTAIPTPTATPTPEPTIVPTLPRSTSQTPKVVSTPNKTPQPVRTPKPKATPKPKQDPNCVFTNSCN